MKVSLAIAHLNSLDGSITLYPADGQFHLRGSGEALTAYGGMVAWDPFLIGCGVIAMLTAHYPRRNPIRLTAPDFIANSPLIAAANSPASR